VDVKTLLLLGAGMAVLSLVGFCSVQSRSASLASDSVEGSRPQETAPGVLAGSERASGHQVDTAMFLMKAKIPVAPVNANR
jgi:hypothetical protein